MSKCTLLGPAMVLLAFAMAYGQAEKPKTVGTVLVAGTGPTDSLQPALDGVVDTLSSAGISAKVLTSEPTSRTAAAEHAKDAGAPSLLYLDVHQVPRQRGRITLYCLVDGKEMWQEKASGGHFAMSLDRELHGMIKEIDEKLQKHIGEPGLAK